MKKLIPLVLLGAAACGTSSQTVYVRAIDTHGEPVPCVVEVSGAAEVNEKKITTGSDWVAVSVPRKPDGTTLQVFPVIVRNGEIKKEYRTSTAEASVPNARLFRATDPPRQLFVVSKPPRER